MSKTKIQPIPDGGRWRVDFRKDGRTGHRYRGTFDTPKEAQEYIDRVLAGDVKPVKATLPGLVDEYVRWSEKVKGKAPETVRCDRARLKVFEAWAATAGIRRPADLDFKAVADYQRYFFDNHPFDQARIHRRKNALNPKATWEKYRQILSSFLVWCIKRGHAENNPAADADFKNRFQRNIPPHFKPDELALVFKYFDDRDAALPVPLLSVFLRLLAYTGMRLGEALALLWADVDLPGGFLHVRKSKNKTVRVIPINPRLRPWLKRLPRVGPRVFDNGRGGPLYSGNWYLKELGTACRDLGLPHRRIHDLRHTFGAGLARARVSLTEIQRLMGHENIQTSLAYIVFFPEELRKAIDALDY